MLLRRYILFKHFTTWNPFSKSNCNCIINMLLDSRVSCPPSIFLDPNPFIQAVVPSTLPSTVPLRDGSSVPFFAFSFAHSSGVWHLAVQACIAAISSLSAELTRRCLFSEFLPANSGETIRAEKACPQPPGVGGSQISKLNWVGQIFTREPELN